MTSRNTENKEVRQIADDLLAYLKSHPEAADTLDGIAQWWLPQNKVRSRADVLRALESLVAEGQVTKHTFPDGRCVFRIARDV